MIGLPVFLRPDLEKAVEIVVNKLDEHFYRKVGQDIVVHRDLREQLKEAVHQR